MKLMVGGLAVFCVTAWTVGCGVPDSRQVEAQLALAESKLVRHADKIQNRYIVVFERSEAARSRGVTDEIANEHDATVFHRYEHALSGFAAEMGEREALAMAIDPRIRYIEEDGVITLGDTQLDAPWGLDRIDQRNLPLDESYTYGNNGAGVHAYVIDSGIRTTHTEFGGRASFGFNAIQDGFGMTDCNGHGTHVAGTIGGTVYGVAKNVQLHGVRVLNCVGEGAYSEVIAGVDWVTANHIAPAVANMSLGGPLNFALDDAVTASINAGVTYAIAAGNDNYTACLTSPARTPLAITVGATDITDTRAWFSNYGACLDLFAPGVDITSAWPASDTEINTISGTSMATPHVAGAIALYLGDNPTATPADVAAAIQFGATNGLVINPGTDSPNRFLSTYCFGAADSIAPLVSLTAPADAATVIDTIQLAATASDDTSLERVEFYVDETLLSSDVSAPFEFDWDTTAIGNGAHTITARAIDHACNVGTSSVGITVDNYIDVTPPSMAITAPSGGSTIIGSTTIDASGTDDVGIVRVDFYGNSTLLGSDDTAPYSLSWNSVAYPNGAYNLTARGVDGVGNLGTSAAVTVTVNNPGGATYDATLRAPSCTTIQARCDSAMLLDGRGALGPEPNAPNTINNSCPDGDNGVYHASESIDRLIVTTVSGQNFATGQQVQVEATVWSFQYQYTTAYELFYAPYAPNPTWTHIATISTPTAGPHVFTRTLTLGNSPLHAIRLKTYYGSTPNACTPDIYGDHDDLIFAATSTGDAIPPTTSITWPLANASVNNTLNILANAADNVGVTQVRFYDGTTLMGTDMAPPWQYQWNTTTAASGFHNLTTRAYDAAGNYTTSAVVQVFVDNQPPTVLMTSPAPNSAVRGVVTLNANASDNRAVTRVDFYVGTTLLFSDTAWPYSATWDASALSGPFNLVARAFDQANYQAQSFINVLVDNVAPTVTLTAPANGSSVSGIVSTAASASDNRGVQRVEFYVGSTLVSTDFSSPHTGSFDTSLFGAGVHAVTARAYDNAGNNTTSTAANVTIAVSYTAMWDPGLQAPRCSTVMERCDSGPNALIGRGPMMGPEPNQPNTINDSCADDTGWGQFHFDGSLDRINVVSVNGLPFAPGRRVRVEATVWNMQWPYYQGYQLFLFHAADANNPSWTHLATIPATGGNQRVVTTEFDLPAGGLQAIRGAYRDYNGTAIPCTTNYRDDHDDVVFAVGP